MTCLNSELYATPQMGDACETPARSLAILLMGHTHKRLDAVTKRGGRVPPLLSVPGSCMIAPKKLVGRYNVKSMTVCTTRYVLKSHALMFLSVCNKTKNQESRIKKKGQQLFVGLPVVSEKQQQLGCPKDPYLCPTISNVDWYRPNTDTEWVRYVPTTMYATSTNVDSTNEFLETNDWNWR